MTSDKRENCIVKLHGQYYDVTPWLDKHPGGPAILLRYAGGKDATNAFESQQHSHYARKLMQNYLTTSPTTSSTGNEPQSFNSAQEQPAAASKRIE